MTFISPSRGERVYRVVTIAAGASGVPWIGMVLAIVKEIYDISMSFKRFRPQVRALADEAKLIAQSLHNHEVATGRKGQLQEYKEKLEEILEDIKQDVIGWANFTIWKKLVSHEEVFEKIEEYTKQLQKTVSRLQFHGVLLHDATLIRHEEQIAELRQQIARAELRREQQEVEAERDRWLQKEDGFTQYLKEAVKSVPMFDIDAIQAAEDKIFQVRIDREHFPGADMKGEVRFMRHMNTWRLLNHQNICPVYGVVQFEPNTSPCLVSPWMKYGNVDMYLKEFPNADKLKLLYETALGLQYLHKLKILHGNLNPSHLLVNINHEVRLTGFSLSKKMMQGEDALVTRSSGAGRSQRWWSPETQLSDKMTVQSDVWGFGMTALAIFSRDIPYKHVYAPGALRDMIAYKRITPCPEEYGLNTLNERIRTLILDCWRGYGDRPSVQRILKDLRRERMKLGWNPDAPPPVPKIDEESPEAF
ncbi:hypothetical protein FRB90_006175 [Tulasnella sp. 427]|nr:hypothetical protein FRB90_006175 [Tulasnella sp. 427]